MFSSQLFDLFSKLYKRFFKESEDPEGLYDDIFDYSNRRGQYALLEPLAVQVKLSALKKVIPLLSAFRVAYHGFRKSLLTP